MDFPVESYSFLPGSRAILDLSYRSRLRNSNYTMSQQSRPTISMCIPMGIQRRDRDLVHSTQTDSDNSCTAKIMHFNFHWELDFVFDQHLSNCENVMLLV